MAGQKGLERLDKAVAAQTSLSRKQVHILCSRGQVLVNGQAVRNFDTRVDLSHDTVVVDGQPLRLSRFSYLMLHKPPGVVCATGDAAWPTVLELVPEPLRRTGLFPAGRLDKDTTGFVLITNDGDFSHKILSPKSHLPKTYLVRLDKPITPEMVETFAQGMLLVPERGEQRGSDPEAKPTRCMPAELLPDSADPLSGRVVIRQGVYHQIKRMFFACGAQVCALHREKIGGLALDPELEIGKCREITPDELSAMLAEMPG